MSSTNISYIVLIVGVICIIGELIIGALTGFDLFIIGTILVFSGSVGIVSESNELMMTVIILSSLAYIFFGRKLIKKRLTIQTYTTNIDSLIGKHARVVKKITPRSPGQVKIEGEIWRAESERTHQVGENVLIRSCAGTTLYID